MPDGPLHATAKAQLLLARGPGRSGIAADWLAANTDLPQAPRLVALAARSVDAPVLPVQKTLRSVSFTPAMGPRAARGDGARDEATIARLKPLLAADRNAEAEAVLTGVAAQLSPDVAAEYYQRIAWSYYGAGDDFAAERMGRAAASGSSTWSGLGGWVAGLAAFRRGDCAAAATAFDAVAARFGGEDYAPAANFWAARSYLACGKPAEVAKRLQSAAAHPDSFYGMLARRTLGLAQPLDWAEPDFITADWNHLSALPGARRAAALVEIGEIGLADRELKYLAATTATENYPAVLRLAARLNLPATQFWLAHHPPEGVDPPLSARYPAPEWNPAHGWRVDKGLVFAHALQESNFVTSATSRVGAKGVMQLMPATAKRVQARMADGTVVDVAARTLDDPEFNIDCGQAYLQELRDTSYTAGLLPKVIAAYNAGPGSVQKWNATVRDNGDPLLFIEFDPVPRDAPLRRGRAEELLDVPAARRQGAAVDRRARRRAVAEVPGHARACGGHRRADRDRAAAPAGRARPPARRHDGGGEHVLIAGAGATLSRKLERPGGIFPVIPAKAGTHLPPQAASQRSASAGSAVGDGFPPRGNDTVGCAATGQPEGSTSTSMPIDETLPFRPVRIAVLTVSDTRTAADDRSGDTLVTAADRRRPRAGGPRDRPRRRAGAHPAAQRLDRRR